MPSKVRQDLRRYVDGMLAGERLSVDVPHPCPYLPDRVARNEGFAVGALEGAIYHALMDRNFRRSGRVIYRPVCAACTACRQIRVPVDRFRPSRSQQRVRRINRDVRVAVIRRPRPTKTKWRLFADYLDHQHDEAMSRGYEDFVRFLYRSPMRTEEVQYRLGRRLVGVSIVDRCPEALSTVYMFFDPAERRRSLGTYSILWEIDHCRREGIPYYYLGYYVGDCRKMAYKANFGPNDLLDESFSWRPGPCGMGL